MNVEYAINFTGTPEDNADNQMHLSAALAEAVGSLNNISSMFADDHPFEVFWEKDLIKIEVGTSILQLTQPAALHQAAILRQAALDGGAMLDCNP